MPEDHDRDRSAETGRFVTDQYAEHHPATTTSEQVEPRGSKRDESLAQNMAAMLTDQLGVPVAFAHGSRPGEDPQWVVVLDLETAQRIYSARAVLAVESTGNSDGDNLNRWPTS